jgi:hypothetical protein
MFAFGNTGISWCQSRRPDECGGCARLRGEVQQLAGLRWGEVQQLAELRGEVQQLAGQLAGLRGEVQQLAGLRGDVVAMMGELHAVVPAPDLPPDPDTDLSCPLCGITWQLPLFNYGEHMAGKRHARNLGKKVAKRKKKKPTSSLVAIEGPKVG